MYYLYGTLKNVDSVTNRITVGSVLLRTSASLSRSLVEKQLLGKYVQVRCSAIDKASEVLETKEEMYV